ERSVFREVIASVTLSTELYIYVCPIPNGFRDRAISQYSTLAISPHSTLYRRATHHVLTRVAKCTDVDGGILKNIVTCFVTEDAVRIVNWIIQQPTSNGYN
ncbi:hypothetical protein B7P43_G12328, partial [Cryptotermes secundus]